MRYKWLIVSIVWGGPCLAEWGQSVGYIFVPGFRQSERHSCYYADTYTASTGEMLICDKTLHVLPSHSVSFNFPEIRLVDVNGEYRPTDLFSRVFSYVQQTALRIFDRIRGTKVVGESVNGQSIKRHWVQASKISLGQQEDIACLSQAYNTFTNGSPYVDLVIYGASRGAATTFSFMGSSYLQKPDKRVRAVILEGCYDSFDHAFSHYGHVKKFFYYKLAHSFIYERGSKPIEPIDFVGSFPHTVPILFIASKKDTIISDECVHNLALQLKAAGHNDVYLLTLNNSSHIGYFCDDVVDTERYRCVVHAFYAAYDLPHIPYYAYRGVELLKQCAL